MKVHRKQSIIEFTNVTVQKKVAIYCFVSIKKKTLIETKQWMRVQLGSG